MLYVYRFNVVYIISSPTGDIEEEIDPTQSTCADWIFCLSTCKTQDDFVFLRRDRYIHGSFRLLFTRNGHRYY